MLVALDRHGRALQLDGAEVGVDVRLVGNDAGARFLVRGGVVLTGARIGGDVECSGEHFHPGRVALKLNRSRVGGNLYMDQGFVVCGSVQLVGARVGGDIEFQAILFRPREQPVDEGCTESVAINAGRVRLGGNLFFKKGFRACGEVRLAGMQVGGYVTSDGASFSGGGSDSAVNAMGLRVRSHVDFRNSTFDAFLKLAYAHIDQSLLISGARFESGSGARAGISSKGASVGGDFVLRSIHGFRGQIELDSTKVGRHLEVVQVSFDTFSVGKFVAQNLAVVGNLTLSKVSKATKIDLRSCSVGQNLAVRDVSFSSLPYAPTALVLDSARIAGELCWWRVQPTPQTLIDLTDATAARLRSDGLTSWEPGEVLLDGFTYGAVVCDKWSAADMLTWLHCHKDSRFRPQPYEQLSRTLRQSGYEDEANSVAKAKYQVRRKQPGLRLIPKLWSLTLEKMLGHGYDARPVVICTVVFVLLGTLMFHNGKERGAVMPSNELAYVRNDAKALDPQASVVKGGMPRGYPDFSPFVYSLDTFFPVIDLQQESFWKPVSGKCQLFRTEYAFCGEVLRFYLWFHISMGWLLTSLIVVSMTSLVRKE